MKSQIILVFEHSVSTGHQGFLQSEHFISKGERRKSILLAQKQFQAVKRNSKAAANNTSVVSGIIENSTGVNQVKPV